MFRVLPRDDTLDDLWRAGLLYSRAKSADIWRWDSPEQPDPPTLSHGRWEFAIFIEE